VNLPRTINIHFFKNEGQEGKRGIFWCRYQWEVGGHKEREKEGEHGEYILCPYMKIEE
jgi:hypothetical protein